MGRFLYLSVIIFTFLFAFQNCGSFETTPVENLSSQCKEEIKWKTLSQGGWVDKECSNPDHYKCAIKIYKPFIKTTTYSEQECFRLGGNNICKDMDVEAFNTAPLMTVDLIEETAFIEGRDYNRSEYRCMHTGVTEYGHPLIVEVSETLEEAYLKAQGTCKLGVRL